MKVTHQSFYFLHTYTVLAYLLILNADENECMAQTLNDCNLDTEYCVNTIGSFDCFCNDGYNRTDGDRHCTGEWRQISKGDLLN